MANDPTEKNLFTKEEERILDKHNKNSRDLFNIGEVANNVMARYPKLPSSYALARVGERSGEGWRRVSKLVSVYEKMGDVKEGFPDLPFSYFESAYDLPDKKEAIMYLEYVQAFYDEYKRLPGADRSMFSYKINVLGLEAPTPEEPKIPEYRAAERVIEVEATKAPPRTKASVEVLNLVTSLEKRGATAEQCFKAMRRLYSRLLENNL